MESLSRYSDLLKHGEKVKRSGMELLADRRRELSGTPGQGKKRLERY